jgi:hypothetical protein
MDVESLRRYKNLQRPTRNLRDYLSDLESVLDELVANATAGRIAGAARTQIEQGSARKPKRVA